MTAPAIHIDGTASIGGQAVFRHLRIDIPAGRWTCLLGESGVGKSTLLRLVGGLTEGIAFTGRIDASDGLALASRAILMQQSDLLLPWANALENTVLGSRLRGEQPDMARAELLLDQVGLSGLVRRRPAELSGGQRQRVALARTLMEDRQIVLLDEPFSALDPRTRRQMQDLASRMLAGRTVVMVTHDPLEAARLGERVLLITSEGVENADERTMPAGGSEDAVQDRATRLAGRMMLRAA